jgi:hypothetical protein
VERALAELGVAQHAFTGEPGLLQGPLLGQILDVGAGLQPFDQGVGEQVGGQLPLGVGAVALAAVLGQQPDADVKAREPGLGPWWTAK